MLEMVTVGTRQGVSVSGGHTLLLRPCDVRRGRRHTGDVE